jgi:hypothetical protein
MVDNVFLPDCQWESDLIRVVKETFYAIEYEIKSSKSDFLSELKNKNAKHIFYNEGKSPVNKLYFILNFDWNDEILNLMPKKFGAIQIAEDKIQIVKPALFLHKEKCCNKVKNALLWIMSRRYFYQKLQLMGMKYEMQDKKFIGGCF